MHLTLNDFRAVLGKVNDGNVVFAEKDNRIVGLKKVNYGWNCKEPTPDSKEVNARVRLAFANALSNSPEARRAGAAYVQELCRQLGVDGGRVVNDTPLDRRTIKAVISSLEQTAGFAEGLVRMTVSDLRKVQMHDVEIENQVRKLLTGQGAGDLTCLRSVDAMKKGFSDVFRANGNFNGFSKAEMMKFIDNNASRIMMLAFERLYLEAYDAKAANQDPVPRSDGGRTLLWTIVDEIMADYGQGREPQTRVAGLVKGPPMPARTNELAGDPNLDALKDKVRSLFPLADAPSTAGRTLDRYQQRSLLRPLLAYLETVYADVAEIQNSADPVQRREAALADFRTRCPAGARLLSVRQDVLDALGSREKAAFGRIFSERLQARLAGVDLQGANGCERLAGLVADVLDEMAGPDKTASLVSDIVRDAMQANNIALTDDIFQNQLTGLVAGGFGRGPKAAKVLGAMLMHRLDPQSFDAPVDRQEFLDLRQTASVQIKESLRGPEVRARLLSTIGDSEWALQFLPESMCAQTDNGKRPADDAARTLAGKVAFLVVMQSTGDLQTAKVLNTNRKICLGDGPDSQEARLTNEWIERELARYSTEDVARTVDYIVRGLVYEGDSRDIFNLINDGKIKAEEVSESSVLRLNVIASNVTGVSGIIHEEIREDIPAFNEVVRALNVAFREDSSAEEWKTKAIDKDVCQDGLWKLMEGGAFGHFGSLKMPREALIRLMKTVGIRIDDLRTTAGLTRFLLLHAAVTCHGGSPEGLASWITRTTGLDLRTVSLGEMPELAKRLGEARFGSRKDPLEEESKFPPAIVQLLDGRAKVSDAVLSETEVRSLLKALDFGNADGQKYRRFRIGAFEGELRKTEGGLLEARLYKDHQAYPIDVPRSADDFRELLVTKIANKPADYPQLVSDILPELNDASRLPVGMSVSRARELCVKVLVAKLDTPSVTFATFDLPSLVSAARGALAGTFTAANLPQHPSTRYNAADIVAVQQAYVNASAEERAKVTMPGTAPALSEEERLARRPDVQTMHNLVSELFLNRDTSVFDRDTAESAGARLLHLRKAYAAELTHLHGTADVDEYLQTFPSAVRARLGELLNAFRALDPMNSPVEAFAAFEAEVETKMNAMMDDLQVMVNRLFAPPSAEENEAPKPWTLTLDEMTGVDGLDAKSPNGKFVRTVLSKYFAESQPTEKRAMLAAYLRNVCVAPSTEGPTVEPSEGFQVGELMKGAGPVFQKMLQGLPLESFAPETQKALQDMKSVLSPIPDPVVRAMLLDLVQSSNGNVLSVDVKKTIGCATVGQAILCHVKTKDRPFSGEDVVIKIMRPNVQTAALREREFLMRLARESGGEAMVKTFEAQFASVLEELDFTREAENVDVAAVQYDRPAGPGGESALMAVRCMRRLTSIPATTGVLVLEKVSGNTFDNSLRTARRLYGDVLGLMKRNVGDGNEIRSVWQGAHVSSAPRARNLLASMVIDLTRKRKKLEQVVTNWVDTALFRSGFLHADLHPGNLMDDEGLITYIDFGNVRTLKKAEKDGIARLFMAAGFAEGDGNGDEVFLKAIEEMVDDAGKDVLKNRKAELKSEIAGIFAKGRGDRVVTKTLAALAAVQRKGLSLPPGLNGFMQSLARLQGALAEIDGLLDDCEAGILKAQTAPAATAEFLEGLEPFVGRVPGIDHLIEMAKRGGTSLDFGTPPRIPNIVEDVVTRQMEKSDLFFVGLDGVDPFPDNDLTLFTSLYEKLSKVEMSTNRSLESKILLDVDSMNMKISALKQLLADPKASPDDVKNAKRALMRTTIRAVYSAASALGGFTPEKPASRQSFEMIVGNCFVMNAKAVIGHQEFSDLISFAYGDFFVDAYHAKAEKQAVQAADDANARLAPENRVSLSRARQLVAAARDFQLPNGAFSAAAVKPADLPEILRVNFATLRKRLGLAAGQRLTEGEINYLAVFFANRAKVVETANLLKKKLNVIMAIRSLDPLRDDPTEHYTSINLVGRHPLAEGIRALDADGVNRLKAALGEDERAFVDALR